MKHAATQKKVEQSCQNHIPIAELWEDAQRQYETWREHLMGPFARRVALEFELEPGQVDRLVEAACDDVAFMLNRQMEIAIENMRQEEKEE